MTPKISIITVCFNAEQTIRRTLLSVSEQTYPHIEYIVVDGASKDKTLELINSLAPQAICVSEADKGIYDAMNKGLKLATGDYVWFLNAGDALPHPHIVMKLVEQACPNNQEALPDVIYGDCSLIDDKGNNIGLRRLRPPHDLSWESFQRGMLVCHQSFIAKRSICPDYNLAYRYSADVDWCIRVMKQAKVFYQINVPISLYLNEGTTTKHHKASLIERFHIMRKHYGLLPTIYWHFIFLLRSKR